MSSGWIGGMHAVRIGDPGPCAECGAEGLAGCRDVLPEHCPTPSDQLLDALELTGASCAVVVHRGAEDRFLSAVVVVRGQQETEEIVRAVEAVQDRWSADEPLTVEVARCPEHGLHGRRDTCFECGGPVEQVPMLQLGREGR